LESCITRTEIGTGVPSLRLKALTRFIFLYDCQKARQTNARRVSFTKELYGYVYSWNTRSGVRQKKKPGLIDQCPGAEAVADSAILVPGSCKSTFDSLFDEYSDILTMRVFEVLPD
jgi:hypothetical protein